MLSERARSVLLQGVTEWQNCPITRHYSFSDKKLWSKQEEILWSVRNNKRTVVRSGNTIGKSFIAADVVFDYLSTHYPSKVITTAPTFTQVEGVLWKEIASYYHNSKIPIGGQLNKTDLFMNDEWFAMGISTNEVYRFQGFHSPNLLVVIDEAAGVPPEIWEAVMALHPHRILAIGNPNEVVGNFYESFQSDLWHKIHVSCYDAVKWQEDNGRIPGLVTREWIEEQRQEWGENSPQFAIHILGEFPEETEDTLIRRGWVERARKGLNVDGQEIDKPDEDIGLRVAAYDIATKHGLNETVECYRVDHCIKTLKGYKNIPIPSTAEKAQWLYQTKRLQCLTIDSDGIGEGVSDILTAKRVPVEEFHGGYGQKAMDSTRFRNLRSQFYWVVAKKFEKGMYDLREIPPKEYEILKNQLCAIKVRPPDALSRIQVETKEDMIARGVKSPDYADAFVYAEYAFYMSRVGEMRPYAYR